MRQHNVWCVCVASRAYILYIYIYSIQFQLIIYYSSQNRPLKIQNIPRCLHQHQLFRTARAHNTVN
jgi:hypothetical protein